MDSGTFYGPKIRSQRFLRDAIDFAETREGDVDIVITGPPGGGDDSDIEQLDDDTLVDVEGMPEEVAGEVDVMYEESDEDTTAYQVSRKKQKLSVPKWKQSHITPQVDLQKDKKKSAKQLLLKKSPELSGASEWTVFQKVFENILQHLVCETNRYATRDKNMPDFQITAEEMYNFIGLLILSGYNMRTCERDYWSKSPDLYCPAFTETMSRNRFQKIKSVFHAADNQSLHSSKMAKIKPLYDLLNQSLCMFGVLHENLSIDESMVPYFGRHSCKQFIRGKPIRFGYKCWVIGSSCGLPYQVTVYEGKTEKSCKEPLGTRVVMECLKICDSPSSHHIYFDNFFTSYDLVAKLKTLGYRATGTIRQNRMRGCPLKTDVTMKKTERGSYDYRSDGDIEIVRWNDNSVVTLCSNAIGLEPIRQVKRRVKDKGSVNVPQPNVVACYNAGMGGVDLMDRSLADYRPTILGKKWYWTLVVNAINIAVVFSWRVYQLGTNTESKQKDFRRSLVTAMLHQSQPKPRTDSRPGPSFSVLADVRTDNRNHYPKSCPVRRCTVCKKNCRIQCAKCNKSLHLKECFQKFHEK